MSKTENNLENKKRFFALYWGQNVYKCANGYPVALNPCSINNSDYLLLKPLSKISDEDLKVLGFGNIHAFKVLYNKEKLILSEVDFLRSKGYAVPYMDLSVKDLIEYGWIKINEA